MNFDCPVQVRQVYGKLNEALLRAEIEKALEQPGADHTALAEIWKEWLVKFSIHTLRPPASSSIDEIRLCQWLAFALRYLHPLVMGNTRPQSGDAVINVINNYSAVVSTLLFSSEQECFDVLKVAFEPVMLQREKMVPQGLQPLIRGVQHRSSDEKTARNWSSVLIEPLNIKVFEYFHTVNDLAFREISISVLNTKQQDRPSTAYQSQFVRYLALTVAQKDRQLYRQALGYSNEFSKRMELATQYAREAKWGGVFLLLILLSVALLALEPSIKLVMICLIMFGGTTLFYGRLFNYLRESFAVARGQLEALEKLQDSEIKIATDKEAD